MINFAKGTITIKSDLGKGTTVTVAIPVTN